MNRTSHLSVTVAALAMAFPFSAAFVYGFGGSGGTACLRPGADIICGNIHETINYAAEQVDGVWYDAFAFGQTHCNVGNVNILFQSFPSNQHPAFAPSLYKLKDGRIEQIGIGWLFHGFVALSGNLCGCACNGSGGGVLGVGCSDLDSAAADGNQSNAGPHWQVNGYTGFFPTGGPANPPHTGSTARRTRVKCSELEPSSASVQYFAEELVISAHDATDGNQNNNASYRQIAITGGPNEYNASLAGAIVREQSAIRAWKASDPAVTETDIQLPNEGLFILAAKASQVGPNTWHYEYALANVTSDLSGQAFRVPLPPGAVVTNIGFHDVDYHSGDGMDNFTDPDLHFSGEDWHVTITNDSIEWATETYTQNVNANALRWGTMYNFRFDLNRAPANNGGSIVLTTYKVPGEFHASTVTPGPSPCASDVAPSDQPNGTVDVADLLAVINSWGSCVPGNCPTDVNSDGFVNVSDLLAIINAWGACP